MSYTVPFRCLKKKAEANCVTSHDVLNSTQAAKTAEIDAVTSADITMMAESTVTNIVQSILKEKLVLNQMLKDISRVSSHISEMEIDEINEDADHVYDSLRDTAWLLQKAVGKGNYVSKGLRMVRILRREAIEKEYERNDTKVMLATEQTLMAQNVSKVAVLKQHIDELEKLRTTAARNCGLKALELRQDRNDVEGQVEQADFVRKECSSTMMSCRMKVRTSLIKVSDLVD